MLLAYSLVICPRTRASALLSCATRRMIRLPTLDPSEPDGKEIRAWRLANLGATSGDWLQANGLDPLENVGYVSGFFKSRRMEVFTALYGFPVAGKDRRCMGTSDRAQAERKGRELLAALLSDQQVTSSGVLPLGYLWQRYRTEAPAFLDNSETSKADAENHANVLIGHFGKDCDVKSLSENDQRAFVSKRLAGGIVVGNGVTQEVRSRSAEVETKLLHSMLRWATAVRIGHGQRLLAHNPLQGVRNIREENPLRPVATWERFTKTRDAARQVAESGRTCTRSSNGVGATRTRPRNSAEATGRRLGSIRQLRWDDWDFERCTVRWRGATDKKGHDAVIPVPQSLVNEVKAFRIRLGGAFGGLMFPSATDRDVAIDRHEFRTWLERAESHAGLPKLKGGLWHAYRRAWATSRKHLPVGDVAATGSGWSRGDWI